MTDYERITGPEARAMREAAAGTGGTGTDEEDVAAWVDLRNEAPALAAAEARAEKAEALLLTSNAEVVEAVNAVAARYGEAWEARIREQALREAADAIVAEARRIRGAGVASEDVAAIWADVGRMVRARAAAQGGEESDAAYQRLLEHMGPLPSCPRCGRVVLAGRCCPQGGEGE